MEVEFKSMIYVSLKIMEKRRMTPELDFWKIRILDG